MPFLTFLKLNILPKRTIKLLSINKIRNIFFNIHQNKKVNTLTLHIGYVCTSLAGSFYSAFRKLLPTLIRKDIFMRLFRHYSGCPQYIVVFPMLPSLIVFQVLDAGRVHHNGNKLLS